jgi:hypothetical protein
VTGVIPEAAPAALARSEPPAHSEPLPLSADDARYGAPPPQYRRPYDNGTLLPFPFYIFWH